MVSILVLLLLCAWHCLPPQLFTFFLFRFVNVYMCVHMCTCAVFYGGCTYGTDGKLSVDTRRDWSSLFIHRTDTAWKEALQCLSLPKPWPGGTTTKNTRLVQCEFSPGLRLNNQGAQLVPTMTVVLTVFLTHFI